MVMAHFRLNVACFTAIVRAGTTFEGHLAAPLAASVAEQYPEASPQVIGDALLAALSAEDVALSEMACVRDYSAPCPIDWMDVGDGGTCVAPDAYEGPCGESVDYRGLSAHEKMLAASRCGAAFPCVDGCTPDYSAVCPAGWSEASGVCEAPADYSGPCVGKKGFGVVNAIGKSIFANTCAVHWPCRPQRSHTSLGSAIQKCSMDFGAACPEAWSSHGGLCIAPRDYKGACPIAGSFGNYDETEKSAIAEACGAPWPCRG